MKETVNRMVNANAKETGTYGYKYAQLQDNKNDKFFSLSFTFCRFCRLLISFLSAFTQPATAEAQLLHWEKCRYFFKFI